MTKHIKSNCALLNNNGGSRPRVLGGAVKLGGAKNVFTCLNTKGCLQQKRLSFVGQKVASFVGRIMLFSGNKHSLKALYIINS